MAIFRTIRKLRKASGREIRTRLRERMQTRRERMRWRQSPNGERPQVSVCFRTCDWLGAATELVPGGRRALRDALQDSGSNVVRSLGQRAIGTAERIPVGAWQLLGQPVDLSGSVDWHRDPRTGFRWPRTFYADVPRHGLPEGVDVKYVWELGRQQYVVELARAWFWTGDEQAAGRARELVLSWIRDNPLYEGVHWTSALEVAVRAISWIWTLAILAKWSGWRPGEVDQIAASLSEHASYLEHHLSFYSSPYNHLIGEATALHLIGWLFGRAAADAGGDSGCRLPEQGGEGTENAEVSHSARAIHRAERWLRLGREVLLEHGPKQFYGDGFCVEQATGYHYFTLGFLSMALVAARVADKPLEELEPVVHRAYRAGAAFRQPDGRWPAIGDVDSARSIPVHHHNFWDFNSLCSLGAVLFDDPELITDFSGPGEEVYWLLGADGVERWDGLKGGERRAESGKRRVRLSDQAIKRPGHQPSVLPDSGYVIASDGRDWLLFDVGPIADGLYPNATPSAAHGHADMLQVLYFMDGRPVLVDSGMYSYNGAPEWLDYFRGPAAHNTVEIEGAPVVRAAGGLAWSHATRPVKRKVRLSDNIWLAYGKIRPRKDVRIERHLMALPGRGLWVADMIETARPRRVRWFWQLPVDAKPTVSDQSSRAEVQFEGQRLVVVGEPSNVRVMRAEKDVPAGWRAPGYGELVPGATIVVEMGPLCRAVVVSHIGRTCQATSVRLGDRIVDWGSAGCPGVTELCEVLPPELDVLWRVRVAGKWLLVAAGDDLAVLPPGWRRVAGVGDWPAAWVTVAEREVSSPSEASGLEGGKRSLPLK